MWLRTIYAEVRALLPGVSLASNCVSDAEVVAAGELASVKPWQKKRKRSTIDPDVKGWFLDYHEFMKVKHKWNMMQSWRRAQEMLPKTSTKTLFKGGRPVGCDFPLLVLPFAGKGTATKSATESCLENIYGIAVEGETLFGALQWGRNLPSSGASHGRELTEWSLQLHLTQHGKNQEVQTQ